MKENKKAAYVAAKAALKAEKKQERREKFASFLSAVFDFFRIETVTDLRVKTFAMMAIFASIVLFVLIDDPEYRGACLIIGGICAATLRARLD